VTPETAVNRALSQFDTPPAIADRVAVWAGVRPGMRVLEPSAGLGHLALAIRRRGADPVCGEIDPERVAALRRAGFNAVEEDFLALNPAWRAFDLVVMNPPFERGQDLEHVLHAIMFAPQVVALLPLGFLEGVGRFKAIWSEYWLHRVAVLVRRFRSDGTGQSAQRPFAVFDIRREPCASQSVEWWD
jgi:predicted RNA methylase